MNYSSLITKRIQLKFSYGLVLLFLVCCELFLPIEGWTQSIRPGVFYFTGAQGRVLRQLQFREFLPGEGLKVGRVKIHPFFGTAGTFTDNVFRTDTQRKSDLLTVIAPGMQAYLPFGGRHSFLLDYRAAQLLYAEFDENNVFAQNGVGHLKLDFPGGVKFNFQGGRIDGFDRRGSAVDIQERDITKWRIHSFRSRARLRGQKGSISLRLGYADLHYKNNGQAPIRDRDVLRTSLTVYADATPRISIPLGVALTNTTFDENKQLDSFSYGVFTGFKLTPTQLLEGQFRIGYTILNFDRAPVQQPPGSDLSGGGKQQKRLTMLGQLDWTPTSRFSLRIRPYRLIRQSAVFDTSTFVSTGININAQHSLTRRLRVQGNFNYRNSEFEEGRTDNSFVWRMGLRFKTVEWLGFRLDYIFGKRISDESSRFEFYSNSIMVSVQGFL